ncbi:MAG: flagellar hook-basal body complex protein FliE [Nitrospinae bacterium]|nr:flagellar hook-basal body complex protein FliE [Nitrospinota bacterium]
MSDLKIFSGMEPIGSALKVGKKTEADGGKFANTLSDAIKEVNDMQINADKAIEDLVTGKSKNIHETMITLSKAEVAMKLTLQVRNKVIEAYKEVMNTSM